MHLHQVMQNYSMRCIGIDFGTTNCLAAFIENGAVRFVRFDDEIMLPSNIRYKENTKFFGRKAINMPNIQSIKRFISNQGEESYLPTKIESGIMHFFIDNSWKSIIEICGDIFLHIRHTTNNQLNENIRNAVISVPARFDEYQRQIVSLGAKKGGWRVLRVVSEPTAGFLGHDSMPEGDFGICDLGGGTFDFSIIKHTDQIAQVVYTDGNTTIGGYHFDKAVFDLLSSRHQDITSIDEITTIRENGVPDSMPPEIKRSFDIFSEQEYKKIADQCIEIVCKSKKDFSKLILIGGGYKFIKQPLIDAGFEVMISDSPQLQVAKGLAKQAYKLQNKSSPYLLLDATPLSLGIETINDEVEWIVAKNSPIPVAKKVVFTNFDEDQTHINFKIVQGEGRFASKCRNLGEFEIEIPKQKPGSIQIEVKFIVNTDGMINIKATNLQTNELYNISISSSNGLSEDLIKSMINSPDLY